MPRRVPPLTAVADAAISAGAMLGASAVVTLSGALRSRGVISGRTARKTVHTLCGVAYLLLWPLYSVHGRLSAAFVPVTALAALLLLRGPLARTISRDSSSVPAEALLGPTVYTVVLLCVTLVLWKQADAYIVIAQLCFGDAAAEVFGRRFGRGNLWPFAKHKSAAGSAAFAAAAALGSVAMLAFYARFEGAGMVEIANPATFAAVVAISIACAAAELIPPNIIGDDNASIAATAAIMSQVLLRSTILHEIMV